MSIADKAIDTFTKNVTLSMHLKEAEAKTSVLQKENSDLKLQLQQAIEENEVLEKKIIELQNNPLSFDDKTGTWISSVDGLHYCAKCKCQDGAPQPLKTEKHGWLCPVCETPFDDPERPRPKPQHKNLSWKTV